jgi:hypothetical protein
MKISKTAWHYRYISWLGFSHPKSLCPYFWKLMFCFAVPVVFAAVVSALVFLLSWAIIHYPRTVLIVVAVTALLIGFVVGLVLLIAWMVNGKPWRQVRAAMPSPVVETVSLTRVYVRSAHRKVCPMLEFTD